MRFFLSVISIFISSLPSKCQEMNSHILDSILAVPQTIELKISSPQPRLKEKVELSLNIAYIRAQIFKKEFGKFEIAEGIDNTDQDFMIMKVNPLEKGKQIIGPISFTMNGTSYTTTKVEYTVIDALPNVDKGVWIRNVLIKDSMLCIIIEQRIPANSRATKINATTTKYWTEPLTNETITMSTTQIKGLQYHASTNSTEEGYYYNDKKEQVRFLSGYSINYYKIIDKNAKIKITKDLFLNLPSDYKFEDIIVQ